VRLQQWETRLIKDIENLQTVIENNSRYWENTTVQSERDKRHEFNEALRSQLAYNQSKLKVVQECLKGL
jgi:nicotinamide riboside kinase